MRVNATSTTSEMLSADSPVLGRLDLLVVHGGGRRQLQRRRPLDRLQVAHARVPMMRRGRRIRRRRVARVVKEDVRVDVQRPPAPQP